MDVAHFWPEYFIDDAMSFILLSIRRHIMSRYVAIDDANFNHLVRVETSRSFYCKEIFPFSQSVNNRCVDTLALGKYPSSSVVFDLMISAYINDASLY